MSDVLELHREFLKTARGNLADFEELSENSKAFALKGLEIINSV
jgi:hypothetical protein